MGYSLSGVWSKLQVMGVVPWFLKFDFFFFFHLPSGISLHFLMNSVISRATTRRLSRAAFILLPQYIFTLSHHVFFCFTCISPLPELQPSSCSFQKHYQKTDRRKKLSLQIICTFTSKLEVSLSFSLPC